MKTQPKLTLTILSLLVIAMLVFVPSALAFDGRSEDRIHIEAGQVVDDDLYATGNEVIIDGTIKGDLIAGAQDVIINGVVEGDVLAAGQFVEINGTVGDDVRIAGYALVIGSDAVIGGDLIAAGYSLDTRSGSVINGDTMYGGYQALLVGEIGGDFGAGLDRLQLLGSVGGNAYLDVSTAANASDFNPNFFSSEMPSVPSVPAGLNLGSESSIAGDLEYVSLREIDLPRGLISGEVTFTMEEVDKALQDARAEVRSSTAWIDTLNNIRRFVALVVVGLLLLWLLPAWIKRPADTLTEQPWGSLGWGFATFFLFPVAFLLLIAVIILLALFMGALTLGNLGGSIIGLGLALLITLGVVFGLIVTYLTKLTVAYLGGRWILNRFKPEWAANAVWPLLLGILIIALLVAIPFLGGLINFIIILFGLGALFILLRQRFSASPAEAPVVVV